MNETTTEALVRDVRATSSAVLTRTAFEAILNGERLSRAELAARAGASAAEVDLLAGRALMLDADDTVVAAHGLSLVPARQHRLTLRGRQFWTWCAIDAIGIPAGLGEHAAVETTCHYCGTPVRVALRGAEVLAASHPDARMWEAARLEGRGAAGPPHCALMNLFCSPEHLAAWRLANATERGNERDLMQTAQLGRSEWGYLRDSEAEACGCADSCACSSERGATL
jgi:alkylmercury lyase